MKHSEITRLAIKLGINSGDAVRAFRAEADARAQGVRIYKWQRGNQEQAKIIRAIVMEAEAEQNEVAP